MYSFFRDVLFRLDPERAHDVGFGAARLVQAVNPALVESMYAYGDGMLGQTVWGRSFPNPIGLAAGFDKNARLVRFWEKVGFGFVEVGSVTALPAKGNPRPRAFRLPEDRALINRMGLNNQGAQKIARRLKQNTLPRALPLGINIAKTPSDDILGEAAIEDFRQSFEALASQAAYIALNISCPNTEDGKTFEDPEGLDALLRVIFEERKRMSIRSPILVKLAPPVSARVVFDSQVEEVVSVAIEHGVHGFIATNTAPDRDNLITPEAEVERIGRGGLSGAPIAERSTQLVRYLYNRTEGKRPIIGVGGIASPEAAYAKIRAGASLVQLYTGLVYEGPGLVKILKEGLVELLKADGFSSISKAIGVDA